MYNEVLASWQRPILLVGDIGAGKTTFIWHLIKVSAKEILRDAVLLYVDLGAFATNQDVRIHYQVEGEGHLVSKPLVLIHHINQRPTLVEPDAVV